MAGSQTSMSRKHRHTNRMHVWYVRKEAQSFVKSNQINEYTHAKWLRCDFGCISDLLYPTTTTTKRKSTQVENDELKCGSALTENERETNILYLNGNT